MLGIKSLPYFRRLPIMFTRIIIMQDFVKYVLGFYGRGGIYDMGATRSMVCDIINIMKTRHIVSPI